MCAVPSPQILAIVWFLFLSIPPTGCEAASHCGLIYFFLILSGAEHLLLRLLIISGAEHLLLHYLEKCPLQSFAHSLFGSMASLLLSFFLF